MGTKSDSPLRCQHPHWFCCLRSHHCFSFMTQHMLVMPLHIAILQASWRLNHLEHISQNISCHLLLSVITRSTNSTLPACALLKNVFKHQCSANNFPFTYCVALFSYPNSRDERQGRPYGQESPEHSLLGPWQEKCASLSFLTFTCSQCFIKGVLSGSFIWLYITLMRRITEWNFIKNAYVDVNPINGNFKFS